LRIFVFHIYFSNKFKIISMANRLIPFILFLITLAVNISMPLFRVYAQNAGFGNGMTALVFATYVTGMLPCFVFLGGLSDVLGRKPVLILSLISSILSIVIISIFPNVYALFFARFFQGIALGLSMGTGTAYLTEVLQLQNVPDAPTKAANATSLSTSLGFGGGALITTIALLIHFTEKPVTYHIALIITIIGLILSFNLPKLAPIGGSYLRLPYYPKGSFEINLAIGICWAVCGTTIAIVPTQLAKFHLTAYAGFCLVLINYTGAFLQPFIKNRVEPMNCLKIGFFLIPIGFGIMYLGCIQGILGLVLLGTACIGAAAYGFTYLGGLALIANLSGAQRARGVAGFMFIGYIGFGVPSVFLGFLADAFGILTALGIFGAIVTLLSAWLFWKLKF
jgi:MFS family permease